MTPSSFLEMNRIRLISVLWVISLTTVPLWPQAPGDAAANADDRMLTPPPVSGQAYPTVPLSQEKSNYLRGGVSFTSAYSDNILGGTNGHPVSDVSYSVAPNIEVDETTSRMHSVVSYAPGFTFYQRTSSRNEADHNASLFFQYRLTPHVTVHAQDAFQKSSNVFTQWDTTFAGAVSGTIQAPNFSIIAPIANRLSNTGDTGLTYQFTPNGMIGGSGTFSNLHYPDPSQVPGLYDSSSQGGSAFYNHRISKMHYLGVSYQYQRFISYVTNGNSETQAHAVVLFYTLYPASHLSISFFGGPQHSTTIEPPIELLPGLFFYFREVRNWTPAAGASLSWQGRLTNVAMSYSHIIAGSGGFIGAVHMDNGTASVQRQLTKRLSASVAAGYTQNNYVGNSRLGNSGHTWSGTASLQEGIGEHLNVQLGYTRLHQTYTNIPLLSVFPDTNREFIAVSYHFSRPLGR